MERKQELLDTLRRSYDGPAWHGPAVHEAISDVTDVEAAFRAAPDGHTIHEIALHIVSWTQEVARRLGGAEPAEPELGDWPDTGAPWSEVSAQVSSARDAVLGSVAGLSEADLDKPCGTNANPPLGTGFSFAGTIEGLAQHNVYHAGQIVLLKKLSRAPENRKG